MNIKKGKTAETSNQPVILPLDVKRVTHCNFQRYEYAICMNDNEDWIRLGVRLEFDLIPVIQTMISSGTNENS